MTAAHRLRARSTIDPIITRDLVVVAVLHLLAAAHAADDAALREGDVDRLDDAVRAHAAALVQPCSRPA